jgi:hypothetical protein
MAVAAAVAAAAFQGPKSGSIKSGKSDCARREVAAAACRRGGDGQGAAAWSHARSLKKLKAIRTNYYWLRRSTNHT